MKKSVFLLLALLVLGNSIIAQNNNNKLPIVFVHGFLGSGDTYATQFQRFLANGYLPSQLNVFDWNSVGAKNNTINYLDSFINKVLANTGANRVNLVGHSAGGGVGYGYLNDTERALKVANYVHIGSSKQTKPAGNNGQINTLNIYSLGDKVVKAGDIPGALNVQQKESDHYEVATSEASFWDMFHFFNPSITNQQKVKIRKQPIIAGKACLMGENTPLANAVVEVYAINLSRGKRMGSTPTFQCTTDNQGNWGPFKAQAAIAYEFVLKPAGGQRTIHYFHEPFTTDDPLVYLRALPKTGMTALLLNTLPSNDQQTVLAIFSSNKAVIAGRDSLTIDRLNLSSETISPATKTAIAHFIFENGDGNSTGNLIPTFKSIPFMNGIDFLLDPNDTKPLHIFYNGKHYNLPKRKSASEGIMVMVLK
jgi:Lipase C-terminal domain/Lipase (class 2)